MTHVFSPSGIWQRTGVTEHLGGINATQRLLAMCGARGSQRALDIGCGSGYTVCRLASDYVAQVSALDISRRGVEDTAKRVVKAGVGERVGVVQADAHRLPFRPSLFDIVVAESVLIFCDVQQVLGEMARVLQPGGVLGVNELTLLQPPPERLNTLLR
ncbi:MAG: class I SAM-dependent methyltransferase [Anaerolineae bacterium]|nr:class I SAM-dependent methyltransferase [Anaerolineae bacterium]